MRKLVLIVDQNDDVRDLYAQYLQLFDYETDQAADGREALAKAISRDPTVIVTDTCLPGIDGYQLCTVLRRDTAMRDVPIIVVTADGVPNVIDRARGVGADIVLTKPCLPESLLKEIEQLIPQAGQLREPGSDARTQLTHDGPKSDRSMTSADRRQRTSLRRTYETTAPPLPPPVLVCPQCDQPLRYERSHIGGVSTRQREQWDGYICAHGCGTFEYRHRSRMLRQT